MKIIRDRIKTAQNKQKSYAYVRKKPLEFNVRDKMYLIVAIWKHILQFNMKKRLTPRYIEPFEVMKRIGLVAYKRPYPHI